MALFQDYFITQMPINRLSYQTQVQPGGVFDDDQAQINGLAVARCLMKSFKHALFAMLAGLQPCLAASAMTFEQPGYYYLGAGVGYGRLNGEDFTNTSGDLEKSKVSWKGVVGINLNGPLALEAQYIDFGAANRDNDRIEATGWTAGAVLDFMKEGDIVPYGKLGALWWETDNRFNNISRNDDGVDVTFGVGVRFGLTPNIALRTEYERFMMDDTDVDNFSLNLQYHFF